MQNDIMPTPNNQTPSESGDRPPEESAAPERTDMLASNDDTASFVTPQFDTEPASGATTVQSPESNVPSPTAPIVSSAPVDDTSSSLQPTPAMQPSKSGKKRPLIVGGLLALALVLFGGGAAAYNLWYQHPDKVLGDALVNAISARSIVYSSTTKLNLKATSPEIPANITVSVDGKGAYTEGAELNVKLSTTLDKKAIDFSGSGIVDKDQNLYFKLENVKKTVETVSPDLLTSQAVTKLIKDLDGKWIKVANDDLKEVNKQAGDTQQCVNDAIKKLQDNDAESKELIDLYKKNPFIVIKNKLGSKDGNLGYEVGVNNDNVNGFSKGLTETTVYKDLSTCDSTMFNADDMTADLTPTSDDDDSTVATRTELWVSRFGHELNEVRVTVNDSSSEAVLTDGEFVFRPQFNAPVKIDAPTETTDIAVIQKDVEAVMKEMFSGITMTAESTSRKNAAYTVMGSVEVYATNNQGRYPASASQLKAYITDEATKKNLTDSTPTAAHPDAIQYKFCGNRQYEVRYYDVSAKKALTVGSMTCGQSVAS